jgi:hypothetical protein
MVNARLVKHLLALGAPTPGSSADQERHRDHAGHGLEGPDPPLGIDQRDQGRGAHYQEDFVVTACWHMRDRFNQREVWERLGLPVEECLRIVDESEPMKIFRSRIFSRIVPTVKDIGLWGPQVQEASATGFWDRSIGYCWVR